MKNSYVTGLLVFLFAALVATGASAQTTSVLTGGLNHPTKVITAAGTALLVAESGTMTANTGRISVVDRNSGVRKTLIGGLPSGVSNLGGPPDTDGVTGIFLLGDTLYVTIGTGDAVINVGPGLELPNPAGASSPLFDSVLEVKLPRGYQNMPGGFTLGYDLQRRLAYYGRLYLSNGYGAWATIRLVANLPDYRAEPRPGYPNNVRSSHLFGVEVFKKDLYVVDAALNLIHRIRISDGASSTFVTFPGLVNPLFPNLGGPFTDAVPDNIHRVGHYLLVPQLTGFPFVPGLAEIKAVNLKNGGISTLIPHLSSAIDVLFVESQGGGYFFTLEFSTNQLNGTPGRMMFFDGHSDTGVVVVPVLITPTSMARDNGTGDIYVTNIFPGTITKVHFP